MPFTSVAPCHACRRRHLKCDGQKPICGRCKRLKKDCEFPGLVLRNGAEGQNGWKFADDQPWLRISKKNLQFVDETVDLAHYYGHFESRLISDRAPQWDERDECDSPNLLYDDSPLYSSQTYTGSLQDVYSDSTLNQDHTFTNYAPRSSLELDLTKEATSASPHNSSPDSLANCFQHDVKEAYLMRYFVEELAQWFDSCDVERHFAILAPHRAFQCPALRYAIFSASARHISRRKHLSMKSKMPMQGTRPDIGSEVALEYQSLCISHLMALSGDPLEVQDENLLAASVILRFYEELDVPLVGVDEETHFKGTLFFLTAQAEQAVRERGFRNAAFWVGVRQKVHIAFINQIRIQFDFNCFNNSIYKTLEPADDSTWANRTVLLCAEILAYCYGDEQSLENYTRLRNFSENWYAYKPSSFNPIYSQAPNPGRKEVFPQIWFLGDCHVTAIQHWHLAQILLAAFDPRVPRMGPNQKKEAARIEAEIKQSVFSLCGIGFSNKTASGPITACMGVSMCGDRVTDRFEQEALLDVLIKTEELQALSTNKAQEQLRNAWA